MSWKQKAKMLVTVLMLTSTCGLSTPLLAKAVEQKVQIEVTRPTDGSQCQVRAVFRGDHDNCDNEKARGRADCSKDTGCVCTRQEKHVSWQIDKAHSFSIVFDQGSDNPFVAKGSRECNFRSNKKGKLRCRVKGKNVPRGDYRFSIVVPECPALKSHIKIY